MQKVVKGVRHLLQPFLQAQSAVAEAEKELRTAKTKMDYTHMSFNYLLGYSVQQQVEFTDQLTETSPEAIDVEKAVAGYSGHWSYQR